MKFLPKFGAALRAGLRWQLLLLWVLVTSISTACLALPVGQLLAGQLDHSVHAAEWAQRLRILMIFDLGTALKGDVPAISGSAEMAALLLFILIPFLNGAFVASARAAAPIRLGELIRESLRQYGPMLRMMFMALLPLAIAGVVEWTTMKGVKHYGEHAILVSDVNHLKWLAIVVSAIVFAWANASIDAGRASLALNPTKRSAIKAWWRGFKLVIRHPLRSLVLYVVVTALAAVVLVLVSWLRLQMSATSLWGFLSALLVTQVLVAVTAWMHFARLFGMLELIRALRSVPPAASTGAAPLETLVLEPRVYRLPAGRGGRMTGIAAELSALADRLEYRHEAILKSWREEVKKDLDIPSNDPLSNRQLFDHIPAMLVKLQRELRSAARDDTGSGDASDEALAVAHGQQRWQQGYDLREVVRELGTLNECVVVEMDAYASSEQGISHQALASARRVWARMYATAIEESLGRYFELQKKEAAGRLEDLEQVLRSVRETERVRIDLWQQAAHDLRGNLSVVANATVGLTHRELLEPTRDEFVRILMRNVTSLHQLLNDVTSLARLEAGKEQPCIEPIDVAAIMHHLCEGVRPLAQERRLFLRCEGPAAFAAKGDAVKIRRIAQNLILNAVRYTRQGGITVSWGESDPQDPKRWEIMIKDTGPGLHTGSGRLLAEAIESTGDRPTQPAEPPDILPTPERQTASNNANTGTEQHGEGIGLAIVKRLCDLLNATIQLETAEFEGTTFRILFPRA